MPFKISISPPSPISLPLVEMVLPYCSLVCRMYSCIGNYQSPAPRGAGWTCASGGLSLQLVQLGPLSQMVTLPPGADGVVPLIVTDTAGGILYTCS